MPLDPDNPRLTDFALGELDDAARAELERELAESPEARAELAEIERMAGLIGASLAEEDAPALDTARRAVILAAGPSDNGAPAVAPLPGQWRGMTTGRWISAVIAAGLSGVILTAMTMQAMHNSQDVAVGTGTSPTRRLATDAGATRYTHEFPADGIDYSKIDRLSSTVNREQESQQQKAGDTTQLSTLTEGVGNQGGQQWEAGSKKNGYTAVKPLWDKNSASAGPNYTVGKPEYEKGPSTAPTDGSEPIAYPDRERWLRLTQAREKYKAFDESAPADGEPLSKNVATGGTSTVQQNESYSGHGQPAGAVTFGERSNEGQLNQLYMDGDKSGLVNGGYTWNPDDPRQLSAASAPATQTFTGESRSQGDAGVDGLSDLAAGATVSEAVLDTQDREHGALYEAQDELSFGVKVNSNRGMAEIWFDRETPLSDDFDQLGRPVSDLNTEAYAAIVENPFKAVMQEPVSTFSIDVDTASYANVRRFLTQNTLPPPGAVRLEEMINYFAYEYAQPTGDDPFAVHVEVAQCPWQAKHRLVRIGIAGREMAVDQRPPSNLVFLIDVSGSMQDANKLALVKTGLRLLTEQLSENDRVAMVVYAGSSGQVLASTPGNQKETILAALDQLEAGGSTNGAGGIEQAYQVAVESFIKGGANRVILCTDGDFNVGVTDESQLVNLIEGKAKSGVFLSVLGFGMGNLKDATLEKLSDKGNGNYAYIDTEREARKVLVEQLSGTLVTIAKDVKLQLEFNPARASAYRLIGYENRLLAKEDFNDDTKDAGEIGAGHTVTALYEVIPAGEPTPTPEVDELEYQVVPGPTEAAKQSKDLLTLKLRYKQPDGDVSKLIKTRVADSDQKIGQASKDYQFAASVAAFGMLLRHSPHAAGMNFGAVLELAQPGLATDKEGYRAEFIELVKKAQELSGAK